jgi:hypothetical protein
MLGSYEEELRKSREEAEKSNKRQAHEFYPAPRSPGMGPGPRGYDPRAPGAQDAERGAEDRKNKNVSNAKTNKNGEGADQTKPRERAEEPYLTFPGQLYPGYPPVMAPSSTDGTSPGAQAGPDMGPGTPPAYYPQYYPPYYGRRPVDSIGATALTLGIVAMSLFWLSAISLIFFIAIIIFTGVGIIFGGYSYASKHRKSIHGLVGLILSIIAISLSSISFFLWFYF